VPQPAREPVMAARAAAAAAVVRAARQVAERCGVPWPAELERAATAYLERELGIPLAGDHASSQASPAATWPGSTTRQ
jgi:hypothetical protein